MKFELIGRWRLNHFNLDMENLVPCLDQKQVYLSKSCVATRYAILGVPAKNVDVIVDTRITEGFDNQKYGIVLEHVKKTGKYNNAVRCRWSFRLIGRHNLNNLQLSECCFDMNVNPKLVIVSVSDDMEVVDIEQYARLPLLTSDYKQISSVYRNWNRYYQHLNWNTDVVPYLKDFSGVEANGKNTISELNMVASEFLNQCSFNAGWTRKFHANDPQDMWIRKDELHV